jgi:DNA-binding winged helix-turn-helix (wHTH) protein
VNQRGASSPGVFLFKGFRFDRGRGELSRMDNAGTGTPVAIGSRASALLGLLVEHQNRLVHKAEIIETVWQGAIVEAANLTVQIATLRRILDSGGTGDSFIQTVARRGYRFIAPVTRLEPQGSSVLPSIQGGCANVRPGAAPTRLTGPCIRSEPPGRLISLPNAMPRLSIVVLPFSGLSHNREQQYFADGITDDLTTDLSRIPDMFVISRNTALTYRGRYEADRPRTGCSLHSRRKRPSIGRANPRNDRAYRCRDRRASVGRAIRWRQERHVRPARRDHGPGRSRGER